MELDEAKHKRTMDLLAAQNQASMLFLQGESIKQADPYFSFTRRILALGLTFGTMVAIFMVPVLFPGVPWIFQIESTERIFFGLFGSEKTTELVQAYGIPFILGEAFTHFVAVVTSFYFGSKMGKVSNPY